MDKLFPARIGFTAIFVLVSIFTVMMVWYITQPIAYNMIAESKAMTEDMGTNTTSSNTMYVVLRFATDLWGPVFLVIILIAYAIVSTQREDWRGYY